MIQNKTMTTWVNLSQTGSYREITMVTKDFYTMMNSENETVEESHKNVLTSISSDVIGIDVIDDVEDELRSWRISKEVNLMPLVVINVLYMFFGVVGNSTVCYISVVRMPRTALNSFVLSLAIAELIGCVLIIPLDITKTMNAYNFDYPKLCKTEKFLCSFVIFFTNCILISIATERYLRIVKPHNRHVTMTQFRLTIAVSAVFATVASIPEAVLAGSQTMKTRYGKVSVCSTYSSDSFTNTIFPPLWACFVVLVYVISTAAIGSIYCIIAVTIWRRAKLQTDRRSKPITPDLTLRRRVQCIYSNEHPSIVYLPPHHSLPTNTSSDNRASFSRGGMDRCSMDQGQGLRRDSKFKPVSSSSDDLRIQVEVHHPRTHLIVDQNAIEPRIIKDKTSSLPWSSNDDSRIDFQDGHYGSKRKTPFSETEQKQNCERDCFTTEKTSRIRSFSESLTRPVVDNSPKVIVDDKNQPLCEIFQEDFGRNDTKPVSNIFHYHTTERKRKEKRKFTAPFLDELYQTINRRRQRNEGECFYSQGSTEDILTPPSLSPMGSIKSRSGFSRKRTTFIMFVMTATTAVSLFPHTVVLLYRLAHPAVDARLTPDDSVLFHVAWNSFFISLACHPYVYGFWNGRFKKALSSMFDGIAQKTKRRRFGANREEGVSISIRENFSRS